MMHGQRIWNGIATVSAGLVLLFGCALQVHAAAADGVQVDGERVRSTSNPLRIAEHIDEHWETGTYDVDGSEYQLQRIIVRTDGDIEDSCGAEDAIHFNKTDEYILEYDSEEATEEAYGALAAEYGEDNVMVDQLVTIDDSDVSDSADGEGGDATADAVATIASTVKKNAAADSVCWGSHLMALDNLKEVSVEEHQRMALEHGVTVAILDTGINAKHEMFEGRSIHADSKSFVPSADPLTDDHGHGSHVAGIIADATCKHAEFLILKVMDKNGQGGMYNVMQGIEYAIDHEAKIINLSLGVDGIKPGSYWYNSMEQVLQKAHDKGLVVITAAGNGNGSPGKDITASLSYPAYSDQVITVGAIDKQLHHANFSYYGDALDFSAPGKSVTSAWKGGKSSYKTSSGTSMAAPEIAATAAMIELYHPGYSPEEIYEVMVEHAVDLGAKGKDKIFGYGYVRMPTAESTSVLGTMILGSGLNDELSKVPGATIKSIRKGKGQCRIAWKKGKGVSGYQVRYGMEKTMSGATTQKVNKASKTSLTVRGLKAGRNYYVQVRCYLKDSRGTYYGTWSPIQKVRVK